MEVALRRRLDGVEHVTISQSQQTTEVIFAPGAHAFSPSAFRSAIGEAEVQVLSLEIDVCGIVAEKNGTQWLTSAGAAFLLRDRMPTNGHACLTAHVDDRAEPLELSDVVARPARSAP